jgi:DNA polymerase elongation subunit (family B)
MQLRGIGRILGPGQKVQFVIVRGGPRVHAWDLPERPDPRRIDLGAYRMLFLRAAQTVLQPFGIEPEDVENRLEGYAMQLEFNFWVRSNMIPKNSAMLI